MPDAAVQPLSPAVPAATRLRLSELAPGVMQSEIRAMTTECDRIGGINLAQGVCDTPVPAPVEQAAIEAIRTGQNIYTRLDGIARLRTAIAAKQQRDYGLAYDPETEVLVASGATPADRVTSALADLGRREITSLFLEGGRTLASAFLSAGQLDESRTFIAPMLLGATDSRDSTDDAAARLAALQSSTERVGEDTLITARFKEW